MKPETSDFKDSKNRWRTRSLFHETNFSSKEQLRPIYTLKDEEYEGLPSIKQIYLDLEDLTEYRIATEYFGGWQHWKVLCKAKWFEDYLVLWREELEIKLRSRALLTIANDAVSSSKSALSSAKYLANKEYKEKRKGRPTKAEIEAERKKEAAIDKQLEEDADSIGLSLVGSKS